MTALALGQSVYDRLDNPLIRMINLYFEANPANLRDNVSLTSRPALTSWLETGLGTGKIRGTLRGGGSNSNTLFAVVGSSLFAVNLTNLTTSNLGAIAGTGRVIMATSPTHVMIASGTILYSTDGATLATVTVPDGQDVQAVRFLNSYFLILVGSQRVYFSEVAGITFAALDYFTAETSPGNLVNIAVNGDELWLFTPTTAEVFAPTGDADLPFQQAGGRVFDIGIYANGRDSVVQTDRGVMVVGKDHAVYKCNASPVKISDATTTQALTRAGRSQAEVYSFFYLVEDRPVYVMHIDDGEDGKTFAYDDATAKWTQYRTYNNPLWNVWSATQHSDGSYYVADLNEAKIWRLDPESTRDDDQPMICEWTGLTEERRVRCDTLSLECSVGIGKALYPDDDPTVQVRQSLDFGATFGSWLTTKLGRMGRFDIVPCWTRLGPTGPRGAVYQFRTSPPGGRFTVRKAMTNEQIR